MKFICLLTFCLLISTSKIWAQPTNDDCTLADRLCPGVTISGTTTGATTVAGSDHNFCYSPSSTVWFMFTTDDDGGDVTIDFTNLVFNPDVTMGQIIQAVIYEAGTPCDATTYLPYSACGSGSTDFSITSAVALTANTTYYVQVNGANTGAGVTQPAECDFDISISGTAVEFSTPTASISATNTVICQGDMEIIDAIVNNCDDTASFDWYYNNQLLMSGDTAIFTTGELSESGYLKLIVNCGDLCIYSDTTDSIFFDVTLISANAGPDKFISQGDQVQLDGNGDGTPEWSPTSTLTNSTSFTPIATPTGTTTYFLTVTSGSCVATDSVNVHVGQVIIVYSGFTPNGDDINDKWIITNSGQFPNMEVRVYDRSGQQVFQSIGYSTQEKWWDGTLNNSGKELPESTYYYVINLNDSNVEDPIFKGMVTIIR